MASAAVALRTLYKPGAPTANGPGCRAPESHAKGGAIPSARHGVDADVRPLAGPVGDHRSATGGVHR